MSLAGKSEREIARALRPDEKIGRDFSDSNLRNLVRRRTEKAQALMRWRYLILAYGR